MKFRKSSEVLRDFVADHRLLFDNSHGKAVYYIGFTFCLAVHISYLIIFYLLKVWELVYFNIGSVIFYTLLLILIKPVRNERSILVYVADIEIIAHSILATYLLGWDCDFGLFLLLLIPTTFLARGKLRFVPFIIMIVSMVCYTYLKLNMADPQTVKYVFEEESLVDAMHITNIFVGLFVMIFASSYFMIYSEYMDFTLIDQRETFQKLASIDPLTQLYNRRAMNENIRAIRRESRTPSTSYVIGIGDIDNFKRINDSYGHDTGDKVLVYVANLLISTIPKGGYAARWGGEEFLFVIPDATIEDGVEFTEKIHKSLRAHVFEIDDVDFGVTMTFGVHTGIPTDKIDNVITNADKRLYKGKNNGKNHTEFTD